MYDLPSTIRLCTPSQVPLPYLPGRVLGQQQRTTPDGLGNAAGLKWNYQKPRKFQNFGNMELQSLNVSCKLCKFCCEWETIFTSELVTEWLTVRLWQAESSADQVASR